jgi:hypothetical protein
VGCCEYGNEHSGLIKGDECLDQLKYHQILKKRLYSVELIISSNYVGIYFERLKRNYIIPTDGSR